MSQPQVITDWPALRGQQHVSRDEAIEACAWLVVSEATSREEASGAPADIAAVAREMNAAGFPNVLSEEGAAGEPVLASLPADALEEVIAQARERAAGEGTGDWT